MGDGYLFEPRSTRKDNEITFFWFKLRVAKQSVGQKNGNEILGLDIVVEMNRNYYAKIGVKRPFLRILFNK